MTKHKISACAALISALAAVVFLLCGWYAAAVVAAAVSAAAALAAVLLLKKKEPEPPPLPPDPTGEEFIEELSAMTDTISRATAERSCGFATQQLYELARFAEACPNPEARETEREILTAITRIHPQDSDEVITEKCEAISELIRQRENYFVLIIDV